MHVDSDMNPNFIELSAMTPISFRVQYNWSMHDEYVYYYAGIPILTFYIFLN